MNELELSKLYKALLSKGYTKEDLGDDKVFTSKMAEKSNRDELYDYVKSRGDFRIGDKDAYEQRLTKTPQQATPTATPQAQAKPQPQSTAASARPSAQPAQTPAPQAEAQPQPQEPAWQPTWQEKAAMQRQLDQSMADFNQSTQAMVDASRRTAERMTPEGRRKLKQAEQTARLMGTPTHMMGLTPPNGTQSSEGTGAGAQDQQPLRSENSPQPYGVVMEGGKMKTQWLMPDGTLTTDLTKADQAEYSARATRLQNQFISRMKARGLDPSKPEDIQNQAQWDAEAPMRRAVGKAWDKAKALDDEAEERYKEELRESTEPTVGNILSDMVGNGMGMNPQETLRGYNREVKRHEAFDLERMANEVYNDLPESYKQSQKDAYTSYYREHPNELKGKSAEAAAEQAVRAEAYQAVYQRAVQERMPKDKTEFFLRKIGDQPFLSPTWANNVAAAATTGSWGMNVADMDAMGQYGQQHRVLDIVGTVANMAIDPTTYISGGMGSVAAKGAMKQAGKFMLKDATKEMAERFAARTLTGRVIGGVAGGAANFATFETLKNVQQQMQQGGTIDPETGKSEGFSVGEVLKSTGRGLILGGATGVLSPVIGNVADKVVKGTTSTAGKVGVRAGELVTSTVAEGTVFSIPEWVSGEGNAFDVWTDNMAMMIGFKASHGIKSAPRVIAELKGDGSRLSFGERVRKRMDASPRDYDFTNEERDELRNAGYGDLGDLFSRGERNEVRSERVDGEVKGMELYAPKVEAEEGHISEDGKGFDPVDPNADWYERMAAFMEDGRVSEAARAKAYYILTGRMLPMSTVTGYTIETSKEEIGWDEEADAPIYRDVTYIKSTNAKGDVVTSRRFNTEAEAQGEIEKVTRQMELNTVDMGERYKDAVANEAVERAAINDVAATNESTADAIRNIYYRAKNGDERMSEGERAIAEQVEDAIGRHADAGMEHWPETIRERIYEESGEDVDKALRKPRSQRTEEEQAAVDRYIKELYPEQKTEKESQQEQAQAIYDESRLLWKAFEDGDEQAATRINNAARRVQETRDAVAAMMEANGFNGWEEALEREPWDFIDNVNVRPEEQDAVMEYINAKAAYDGIKDASAESVEAKSNAVREDVLRHTHKDEGYIIPATMKVDDRPVYIIKGDVALLDDGRVDVRASSPKVYICDAETGKIEMTSPDQIYTVGEAIDPQEEIDKGIAAVEQEAGINVPSPEQFAADPDRRYNRGFFDVATADGRIIHANVTGNVDENGMVEVYSSEPIKGESRVAYFTEEELDQIAQNYVPDVAEQLVPEMADENGISTENREMGTESGTETANSVDLGTETPSENILGEPSDQGRLPTSGNNEPQNIPPTEAAAPQPAPEYNSESALSAIPKDAEGNPQFEAVSPDMAWDGLVELMEDEPTALEWAKSAATEAEKDAKKAADAVSKVKFDKNPNVYKANRKAAQEAAASAQAIADHWKAVVEVENQRRIQRQAEEARKRLEENARLHDEAQARFEQEQLIKKQKEEEQRERGAYKPHADIVKLWNDAPKTAGRAGIYTLADGTQIKGRYILAEMDAVTASHDPETGFESSEGFPVDELGHNVNTRDYKGDKDAQGIVRSMSSDFDSRGWQEVPVWQEGVTLSGNNRMMSRKEAGRQGTDGKYVGSMKEYGAEMYGFAKEDVDKYAHPTLGFVPDEPLPYTPETFDRFNAQNMKSQSKTKPFAEYKSVKPVTRTVLDVVSTIVAKGKKAAAELFQRSHFDVAKTPDFMKKLGLTGDRFTISYGVIARHFGKDSSHGLTEEEWNKLPDALQKPFAITKFDGKENGYRLYTVLQNTKGEYVVVGVDVKNAGKDIDVNSIATVFGRRNEAGLTEKEEVIYRDEKITPEQQSLLDRPNSYQYPANRESNDSSDGLLAETPTPFTPKTPSDNLVSDGKDSTLSADKQEGSGKSSYTVTPTVYEGKHKKTNVWAVDFGRELTTEEKGALKAFADTPLAEGRKTTKGWFDRKSGRWLMRSEEAARQLGDMLCDAEAMADHAPLSTEDVKNAIDATKPKETPTQEKPSETPAEKPEKTLYEKYRSMKDKYPETMFIMRNGDFYETYGNDAKVLANIIGLNTVFRPETRELAGFPYHALEANVKKLVDAGIRVAVCEPERRPKVNNPSPMNRVDISSLTEALKKDGEAKLSDHSTPVGASAVASEQSKPKKDYEVSDEEMGDIFKQMRDLLGSDNDTDVSTLFRDPGTMTKEEKTRLQVLGMRAALAVIERGAVKFEDFARLMIKGIGDEVRPWLKIFYGGQRYNPDFADLELTSDAELAAFDVMNFDKAQPDVVEKARGIANENKAKAASDEAMSELKQERNEKRKEDEQQREADTEALASEAEALADEIEALEEAGELDPKEGELTPAVNEAIERIDNALDEISDQLALLGYYEAEKDEDDFNEAYGYMRNAEKKAVKDAARLAKQLISDLGLDMKAATTETKTTRNGRTHTRKRPLATANIAPAGGDVSIRLPLNEGRELYINISLDPVYERGGVSYGSRGYGDNLEVKRIMFRVEDSEAGSLDRIGINNWADADITYSDLLGKIEREIERRVPKATEPKAVEEPKTEEEDSGITPAPTEEEQQAAFHKKIAAQYAEMKGFRIGDKVVWDAGRQGRHVATLHDVDHGRPIIDTGMGPMIYEVAEWEDLTVMVRNNPAVDISESTKKDVSSQEETPKATATEPKPKNGKKPTVEPTATIGGLFDGLTEEEPNNTPKPTTNGKRDTDIRPRPGTAKREEGHEPRPNEPLGKGAQPTDERPEQGAVGGRGGTHTGTDTAGGRGISHPSGNGSKSVSRPKKAAPAPLKPEERKNTRNNHVERGVEYAPKSGDARIRANIEAIGLAKRLLGSGAEATREEMLTLRQFSGWGGLGNAFSYNSMTDRRLRELLTPEQYEAANLSRKSAYFTPTKVIDTMWDVARALGFEGGRMTEGSAGVGNIIAQMPTDMAERTDIHAVEIDEITGGILSLLYPDAKVDIKGFEQTSIPNNSVDLAITNVPFVTGLNVHDETGDSDLSKQFRSIHDFCIAKNVRKLKPGGIGIFISSSGTLDKSDKLRAWLVGKGGADVVGAFRLHNSTFGGTDATSDIIVVRKRVRPNILSPNAIDIQKVETDHIVDNVRYGYDERNNIVLTKSVAVSYNQHFIDHPEDMGGVMMCNGEKGDTYRATSLGCFPDPSIDQNKRLEAWLKKMSNLLPEDTPTPSGTDDEPNINEKLGAGVKEGTMLINTKGEICMARRGEAVPMGINTNKVKGKTKAEVVEMYDDIKKAVADVLEYQTNTNDDHDLQPLLDRLNKAYDRFTKLFGPLTKNKNLAWLRQDIDYPSIAALENYTEVGDGKGKRIGTATKTDIFSKRVVGVEPEPAPKTVSDAVITSIYRNGGIDMDYICDNLGIDEATARKQMIEAGLAYESPITGEMEVSYQYLSGNVREKLKQAEAANADGRFAPNIAALSKAIPLDIPSHLIDFQLGSSWVEPKLYTDFIKEKTDLDVKIKLVGGRWVMDEPYSVNREKNKAMGVVSEIVGEPSMGMSLSMPP